MSEIYTYPIQHEIHILPDYKIWPYSNSWIRDPSSPAFNQLWK